MIPNGFEENFTVGFAKGLAARGVEFVVISCDETAGRLDEAGIPNLNLRGSLRDDRPAAAKVWNLLRYYLAIFWVVFKNRGHTVHFTGIFQNKRVIAEGLAFSLWFRLCSSRFLYTVHNVLPHGRTESGLFHRVYRWIYRMPNTLIVHTRKARQQLVDGFGVPADKIRVSSIGLNEEVPAAGIGREVARRELGLGTGDRVILFFGKIDRYKGLDVLLAAHERLATGDCRLVIAGEFRDAAYRREILDQLDALPGRERIDLFEGFVPNADAERYFEAADVLCLPYRDITQSGLLFLAPRFGLPMVTTDVGALREFVDGRFGLVADSNDAPGLAAALDRFFAEQGEYPRDRIVERAAGYRWSEVCADIAGLYRSRRPDVGDAADVTPIAR